MPLLNSMKIESLFPSHLAWAINPYHSKYEQELSDRCYEIQKKVSSGGQAWLSKNTYNTSDGHYTIHLDPKFKDLTNWIVEQVNVYTNTLKMRYIIHTPKHYESWFNIYKKYDYQELHKHNPSVISCIYFLKADDTPVFFKSPIIEDSEYNPQYDIKYPPVGSHKVDPEPGKLLIFRSYLEHAVAQKVSDTPRITLAYNFRHHQVIK